MSILHRQLYHELHAHLRRQLPRAAKSQVRNQALLTQALAVSPNCHLATLATYLPISGQRANLVQRLRRWLANQAVTHQRHYMPLVHELFGHWSGAEISLVLDRTDIGRDWSILMLAAAFRHRARPLAWRILPFGGPGETVQLSLLQQIQPALLHQGQMRITLYGDAEFRAVGIQRYCQTQHWHWHLGLKSDILFRHGPDTWGPLAAMPLRQGERRYVNNVYLTQQHDFGPVHLVANWTQAHETARYFVSDQPTGRHTWRRGRKRFWIEPFFRDWKSYGFDLERRQIATPDRQPSLLLAMATASLWLTHIGQWVLDTSRQILLQAAHKRDYSVFRLGRDYAQRSLVRHEPVPIGFTVTH